MRRTVCPSGTVRFFYAPLFCARPLHRTVEDPYTAQCTTSTPYSGEPLHRSVHDPYTVQCRGRAQKKKPYL